MPFARITTWFMLRVMKKEARRLAKEVTELYSESKSKNPSVSIIEMAFDQDKLSSLPEDSRRRIETCCETIQGFCYMWALDYGALKGVMNFRSLQFTHYMDRALESQGFPPQSKAQKERILEAMGLKIDRWEDWSGDR